MASRGEGEEDEALDNMFHSMVLSGKLHKAVNQATTKEGGGCLLSEYLFTKTRRLVV